MLKASLAALKAAHAARGAWSENWLSAGSNHRSIKRLVRPGLGFGSLRTARRTLAGYEVMAMIRKGQVHDVGGHDGLAQAAFIAGLFGPVV